MANFGTRRSSVPTYTRQFETLGPMASLSRAGTATRQSLAALGAQQGLVPALFAGARKLIDTQIEEDHKQRAKEIDRLATAEGLDAGRKAALEGMLPAMKEADTLWGQKFNAAQQTAYLAEKDITFRSIADKIYLRTQRDPEAFSQQWDEAAGTFLGTLPKEWQPAASVQMDKAKAEYAAKVRSTVFTQDEQEANAKLLKSSNTYLDWAANAYRSGNMEAGNLNMQKFIETTQRRTDLTPQQGAQALMVARDMASVQSIFGAVQRTYKAGGLEEATRLVDDFAAGRAGGSGALPEDRRQPIVRSLKAQVEDWSAADRLAKAKAETQRKQAYTQRLDAVTQAIDAGQYGQADLERDAQAGLFADAPEAVRTFTRAITQRHDREEARQLDLQRVNDAQAGKAVLDPAKPEDVAAVDTWWTARRDADPKGALTDATAIAKRTRILPDAARQQILDGLAYGTPEKQAEAAKALDALDQDAPAVAEALPLAARNQARVIAKRIEQGQNVADATRDTAEALKTITITGVPEGASLSVGTDNGTMPDGGEDGTVIDGGAGGDTLMGGVGGGTLTGGAGGDTPAGGERADGKTPSDEGGVGEAPEDKAEAQGHPVAPAGTPAPWREILDVMDGGEGEAIQDLAGMIPDDPDDASDELVQALGELGLSLVPGVGEALSAKDAYQAIVAAHAALKNDDLATAIEQGALAGMAGLGAIPGAGALARLGKGGIKVARAALKVFRKPAARLGETVARTGRSISDTWFASWTRGILKNPQAANHGAARVGQMQPKVQEFMKGKGVELPHGNIGVTDDALVHMNRADKPPFKRVPPEMIEKIPEILRKPDEILWELRHERGEDVHTLLYVKHLKGGDVVKAADSINDRNRAKFVVKVDVDAYFQQGGKRVQSRGNWVWSAGRVATGDLKSFERVWP